MRRKGTLQPNTPITLLLILKFRGDKATILEEKAVRATTQADRAMVDRATILVDKEKVDKATILEEKVDRATTQEDKAKVDHNGRDNGHERVCAIIGGVPLSG